MPLHLAGLGQPVIVADGVSVLYHQRRALDNVSFDICAGEIFALLGSNGAGKSTLLSCLYRMNRQYTGSLKLMGQEVRDSRAAVLDQVALVPQEYSFFFDFTVMENLRFGCTLANLSGRAAEARIRAVMEEYHLTRFAAARARHLSGGYKRLLNIALSALKDPRIVLLDEPTAGLDVSMRRVINDAIRRFRARGVTVVLTTHYLEDVEEVCDRAVLLTQGRVLDVGTLDELIAKKGGPYLFILSQIEGDQKALERAVERMSGFSKKLVVPGRVYLIAPPDDVSACLAQATGLLNHARFRIGKVDVREPSLNKAFLGIVEDRP